MSRPARLTPTNVREVVADALGASPEAMAVVVELTGTVAADDAPALCRRSRHRVAVNVPSGQFSK